MPRRAAWLRLLVTVLLCVVGVARPLAQRADATTALRAKDPMHVSASTREGELVALRKRGAGPSSDDQARLVPLGPELAAAARDLVDPGAARAARPSSAALARPRARGPPLA